jgi:predicted lipid-binding transport protein (Tim44 family)
MILMAFENADLSSVKSFLSDEVYGAFESVIKERESRGLVIEAEFRGVLEIGLMSATFDAGNGLAEIDVRFVCKLISVVRDRDGKIVEGSETEEKRQRDVWTFARAMDASDPNWQLVATGE